MSSDPEQAFAAAISVISAHLDENVAARRPMILLASKGAGWIGPENAESLLKGSLSAQERLDVARAIAEACAILNDTTGQARGAALGLRLFLGTHPGADGGILRADWRERPLLVGSLLGTLCMGARLQGREALPEGIEPELALAHLAAACATYERFRPLLAARPKATTKWQVTAGLEGVWTTKFTMTAQDSRWAMDLVGCVLLVIATLVAGHLPDDWRKRLTFQDIRAFGPEDEATKERLATALAPAQDGG